jgi:sodium/bile acid cotransporter 7
MASINIINNKNEFELVELNNNLNDDIIHDDTNDNNINSDDDEYITIEKSIDKTYRLHQELNKDINVSNKDKLYKYINKFLQFFDNNYFICMTLIVILLAFISPSIGRSHGPLKTQITFGYGCNILVFLISGISLKTEALINAFIDLKLNICIQGITFGLIPVLFYLITLPLKLTSFSDELLNGFVILGCLPMTVNMCYVLTSSANANDASALFNATFGNIIGIFISPLLILGYLNQKGTIVYSDVILKLTYKVIIPLISGQIIINFGKNNVEITNFLKWFKPYAKRSQETCLGLLMYQTFCNTFYDSDTVLPGSDVIIILLLVISTQFLIYFICWIFYSQPILGFNMKDRVCGFYCSSHKTMALGIPLITTMYETNPNLGVYTIPLLIYHPCLIFFGSLLLPKFKKMIQMEDQLKLDNNNDNNNIDVENTNNINDIALLNANIDKLELDNKEMKLEIENLKKLVTKLS